MPVKSQQITNVQFMLNSTDDDLILIKVQITFF